MVDPDQISISELYKLVCGVELFYKALRAAQFCSMSTAEASIATDKSTFKSHSCSMFVRKQSICCTESCDSVFFFKPSELRASQPLHSI